MIEKRIKWKILNRFGATINIAIGTILQIWEEQKCLYVRGDDECDYWIPIENLENGNAIILDS